MDPRACQPANNTADIPPIPYVHIINVIHVVTMPCMHTTQAVVELRYVIITRMLLPLCLISFLSLTLISSFLVPMLPNSIIIKLLFHIHVGRQRYCRIHTRYIGYFLMLDARGLGGNTDYCVIVQRQKCHRNMTFSRAMVCTSYLTT